MGVVLPSPELLQAWGKKMRGKIMSRQRCPRCGRKGKFNPVPGARVLVCECGQFPASKFDIVLWWQGKTRWISHDTEGRRLTDYVDAETVQAIIDRQIKDGEFYPAEWASSRTNRFLWENYLKDYRQREKQRLLPEKKSSWAKKRSNIKHLIAAFAGKNIREIRTAQIADWLARWENECGLAPKTRADIVQELRHVFTQAYAREEIKRIPQFPAVEVPQKEIEWLLPDEQARILMEIATEHRPIFQFLMNNACRVAEACALLRDQVHRKKGYFVIARTLSRRRLVNKTKTKRPRMLPIMPDFEAHLDAMPPAFPDQPVFVNPGAIPGRNPRRMYMPDFLNSLWRQACKDAGVKYVPLKNGTRHSWAMQKVNLDGWSLDEAAEMLGHTSSQHTRKYANVRMERLRDRLSKSLARTNAKGFK